MMKNETGSITPPSEISKHKDGEPYWPLGSRKVSKGPESLTEVEWDPNRAEEIKLRFEFSDGTEPVDIEVVGVEKKSNGEYLVEGWLKRPSHNQLGIWCFSYFFPATQVGHVGGYYMDYPSQMINTPPNVPAIKRIVEFWSYRKFFNDRPEGSVLIYQRDMTEKDSFAPFHALRVSLAEITSPQSPVRHLDNHSGWEVRLKNGKRAFFFFSDFSFYVYEMPEKS